MLKKAKVVLFYPPYTGEPLSAPLCLLSLASPLLEAGFDVRVRPQATVGLYYFGQLANNAHDNSVKGNFTWKF